MSQLLSCHCEEMSWPRPLLKRAHLIGDLLTVSEVSPLSSWKGAGRRGAGEGAESYMLVCREEETLALAWVFETSKTSQWHTFNKATTSARPCLLILILSNRATSWWLIIQIYAPVSTSPIQTTTASFLFCFQICFWLFVVALALGGKDKPVPLSLRYRQTAGRCVD